ncbi:MAG: helix-turn-helix domain-containing protein [Bacteroides sp.]|nr:helix-turn-helix domain-containing protein [Bacteroides sp.]MCM1456929.1 helix-turn-helix domain-containing protein [Lachnoclostridium sp.]
MRPHPTLLSIVGLLILIVAPAAYTVPVHAAPPGHKEEMARLKQVCQEATQRSEHLRALILSERMLDMAKTENDNYYMGYALYYQGLSNVVSGKPEDGKAQLDSALAYATALDNDTLLMQIHNGYGIYQADTRINPALAQRHFFKSLEYAVKIGDGFRQALVECNLAEIACIRKDPEGLKYARSCYQWGLANDNPQMIFSGAYQCANLYRITGDNDRAMENVEIANDVLKKYGHQDEESALYRLRGSILFDMGRYDEAELWLDKALTAADRAQASNLPEIYLCYAKIYARSGNISRSDAMIQKGLRACDSLSTKSSLAELYELKSQNRERAGDYRMALEAYKLYKIRCDSIYDAQERQSVNELRVQYDIDKREREADLSRLMLANERNRNAVLVVSLCSVLLILIILTWHYQKLRRLYKKIVIRQREEMECEKAASMPREERTDEIYANLCRLMEEEKIYTDSHLTRDRVAEMLGTNRTYLTQIIKTYTGKSYPQFVNGYRIRHALRVLSDAETADYPLKALSTDLGFSSLSTFYKTFQNEVGMTPSMYKNIAKDI